MKKKILSGVLLSSAIVISLSAVAASCGQPTVTPMPPSQPMPRPTPPPSPGPTPPMTPMTPMQPPARPDAEWKKELNAEAAKVTVTYSESVQQLTAEKADKTKFVFAGFDATKYKVTLSTVYPYDWIGGAAVRFNVEAISDATKKSDLKEVVVMGFMKIALTIDKLKTFENEVAFDYVGKENIYAFNAVNENIRLLKVPPGINITSAEVISFTNPAALVYFTLSDPDNPAIKYRTGRPINGFKIYERDLSDFAKIILDAKNKHISLNLKGQGKNKIALHKELFKPNTEITFKLNTSQIIVPINDSKPNIADPKTYQHIGDLTRDFRPVYTELRTEINKILTDSLKANNFDLYAAVSKLLFSSKEEALKELETIKTMLPTIRTTLLSQVTFMDGLETNITKVINDPNFSVAYDLKTGLFVMQNGTDKIDFSKPATYTTLFEFKPTLKDKIMEKIKSILEKHMLDPKLTNIIVSDLKFNTSFVIQRSNGKVETGLKIQQK